MKIIIFLLILTSNLLAFDIEKEELDYIGQLIYKNETGGKKDKIIVWNVGEEFISLGIGHFIWYPYDFDGPFEESFPKLIEYFKEKNYDLPRLFYYEHAPYFSRDKFYEVYNSGDMELVEAREFLYQNKDIQIMFILERLENSLALMLEKTSYKERVMENYEKLIHTPMGVYPLLDYVNFKGEGVRESERYNGQGWGLLQVLEGMDTNKDPVEEFVRVAKTLLYERVLNSPEDRGEARWLEGWNNRLDTYTKERDKYKK